ncbi:hypothetical protein O0544_08795 [Edwardsiella anguillarum]|nr:hypothetical protein [Edwardsiella anguillarum]
MTMWPSLFEDDEVLNPHRKAPIYSSSSLLNLMMMVASSDYVLLCGKGFAQEFARLVEIQVLDHPWDAPREPYMRTIIKVGRPIPALSN